MILAHLVQGFDLIQTLNEGTIAFLFLSASDVLNYAGNFTAPGIDVQYGETVDAIRNAPNELNISTGNFFQRGQLSRVTRNGGACCSYGPLAGPSLT